VRVRELERTIKDPESQLKRREKSEMGKEIEKLKESPFFQHFGQKDFDHMIQSVDGWNKKKILQVEDKAMDEDRALRTRIEEEEKQLATGEIIRPEDKVGVDEINPRSRLASMLQKTESLEALRRRRQENLGLALGSLETVAALNVALRESSAKGQLRAAGISKIPEEGEVGEKLKYVTSPNISERNDVRIDVPGPVEHEDPDQRDLLRHTAKLAAYDYARNQLGLSDNEIHEVDGTAMAVPRGKLAVIGVDKNGAHVRVKLGGPVTQAEIEAQASGKKTRARGLLDKIPRMSSQQSVEDRNVDIKNNQTLPTRADHPPLIRETMRSNPDLPMEMKLAQYNAYRFMKEPKLLDESGKPIRGSEGGLNTMVTGGGKTLASLASIAGNHQAHKHMNYVVSVPPGMVQQWVNEANEMTNFHTVGLLKKEEGKTKREASKNEFTEGFEAALVAQSGEKHPTPIVVGVPNGPETAKGYGIKGWGKEQQHEFFKKIHDLISKNGSVARRNIVFVMQHDVDSNIHSRLTKTQLGWGSKYAQEYLGGKKAKEGDVIDHFSRLGVRGRIVDEPQKLLSSGETSNRSAAGQRIFSSKHPMEYRMLLTATPARRQLSEAYDAVKWVAKTPVMSGDEFARDDKGKVQYHVVPGLPGSGDAFMSKMGGLGRGTFTHDHIMQKQAQQMFANWNIGDEQRERHYRQTTHNHEVTRTDAQRMRQIEIEKDSKGIIQKEREGEAKKLKMSVPDLMKKQKIIDANAVQRGLQYSKAEHRQNITGAGVVREDRGIARRTKGAAQLPRTDVKNWRHNSKINALIDQVKKLVDANPEHKIVVVADNPDQVAAIKTALEETVYKPTVAPEDAEKKGGFKKKISYVSTLGKIMRGETQQEAETPKPEEMEQRKADFREGKLKALIIDADSAAGHNLQTANSMHMMSYLGDAATLMQAQGRADRPGRPVRQDREVTKEILGVVKHEGTPSLLARKAIWDAMNEAHEENPDKFPQNLDVKKLSDGEVGRLLADYRKYNSNKWQALALKIGVFTESPLEVHAYHMMDAPQELQEYDLIRRGMKNNEVTTPALMTEPHGKELVRHTPTGKEIERVKIKSLYLRHDLMKGNPSLIVRN
jgi:hypothetical protein